MMRLIYADHALSDLEGIMDYIGRDNPAAAVRFGEGLLKTADLLEQNPELGYARDELAKGLRVFAYRGYGLYYRIDTQQQAVILERVLHPAVDVRRQSFD
jgi:toxin ParE1/3/4